MNKFTINCNGCGNKIDLTRIDETDCDGEDILLCKKCLLELTDVCAWCKQIRFKDHLYTIDTHVRIWDRRRVCPGCMDEMEDAGEFL